MKNNKHEIKLSINYDNNIHQMVNTYISSAEIADAIHKSHDDIINDLMNILTEPLKSGEFELTARTNNNTPEDRTSYLLDFKTMNLLITKYSMNDKNKVMRLWVDNLKRGVNHL